GFLHKDLCKISTRYSTTRQCSIGKSLYFWQKEVNMLKAGVLGAGHLGKIHIKLLHQSEKYHLVGFYDPHREAAQALAAEYGVIAFESVAELIDAVDVVDIVTPTLSHYDCAVQAFRKSKHVFIEKPITNTVQEAQHLISLAQEAKV